MSKNQLPSKLSVHVVCTDWKDNRVPKSKGHIGYRSPKKMARKINRCRLKMELNGSNLGIVIGFLVLKMRERTRQGAFPAPAKQQTPDVDPRIRLRKFVESLVGAHF